MGYQILAVSPDLPENLQPTVERHQLRYQLLSDSEMKAAQAYGIAFRVDDQTLERYKGFGIDLEARSGETHHLLPVPAVFIYGKDGKLAYQYVHPDYRVRLPAKVLLAAAEATLE